MKILSDDNLKRIELFNAKLVELEKQIFDISMHKGKIALKEVIDNKNNITDFELELTVDFIYSQHNEVKSVAHNEYLKADLLLDERCCSIANGKNYNRYIIDKESKLKDQYHCWLLSLLYSEYKLSFDDILSIKSIRFNICIIYIYDFHIKTI